MGRDDRKKRKHRREDDDDWEDYHKKGLASKLIEKTLGLADSPLSYTIIKAITTVAIGFTTVATVAMIGAFQWANMYNLTMPAMAIVAGFLTTAAVWVFGNKGKKSPTRNTTHQQQEIESLIKRVNELEERLANVEIIESFENRLARREIDQSQLESLNTGETTYAEISQTSTDRSN